ncbi:MAG: ABC transporter permease [Deltaproteobacteria bacterium]|nr:MAG: ABC transporter permease [Deltaproteobacteria bacterium]
MEHRPQLRGHRLRLGAVIGLLPRGSAGRAARRGTLVGGGLVIAALLVLPIALLACSGGRTSEQPDAPTPEGDPAPIAVRLALNWFPEPEFGGFYQGVLDGTYSAAGFDVEIIPGGPGAPTLELLESGKAEAAITSADDLLVKRDKGVRAVALWAGFQRTPVGLMAHADSGLERIPDLLDHPELRVAVEIGSPFQRWLWQAMGFEGKVATVPTTGSVAAFLADPRLVQQAYITSEPCVARARGVEVRFLAAADVGWNPYGTVLAVADPPPPWAEDFRRATRQAWTAYLADPAAANQRIAQDNDQLTAELLTCISDAQRPYVTGEDGLGAMTEARWRQTRDALVTVGVLKPDSRIEGAWISSVQGAAPTP